jgi:cytochrome P450
MTSIGLDRERIRNLFDLRRREDGGRYVTYTQDLYPKFHELRESGPVHPGVVHELIGYTGTAFFQGLPESDRPHWSVFSFAECNAIFRNDAVFRSSPPDVSREDAATTVGGGVGRLIGASMIAMNGPEHRRNRALVQPSFVPASAKWWIENWIRQTVHDLIDGFESAGRADLNLDFCAAIPMLTITGSFGLSIDQALDVRATLEGLGGPTLTDYLAPIIDVRRDHPTDDLLSVLCQAELQDPETGTHRLSDEEILAFANLLLLAGSGTTWKQMGITLLALLSTPGAMDAVREDRTLLRNAVEESLRWNVTDPMFSRWTAEDTTIAGVDIPAGAVVHACVGSANRDPLRWQEPDAFDIRRELKPSLCFASGPHVCLGQHVARAEMLTSIGALIDRLPNLRLDPEAEPPGIIGLYERGPTHVPVLWG